MIINARNIECEDKLISFKEAFHCSDTLKITIKKLFERWDLKKSEEKQFRLLLVHSLQMGENKVKTLLKLIEYCSKNKQFLTMGHIENFLNLISSYFVKKIFFERQYRIRKLSNIFTDNFFNSNASLNSFIESKLLFNSDLFSLSHFKNILQKYGITKPESTEENNQNHQDIKTGEEEKQNNERDQINTENQQSVRAEEKEENKSKEEEKNNIEDLKGNKTEEENKENKIEENKNSFEKSKIEDTEVNNSDEINKTEQLEKEKEKKLDFISNLLDSDQNEGKPVQINLSRKISSEGIPKDLQDNPEKKNEEKLSESPTSRMRANLFSKNQNFMNRTSRSTILHHSQPSSNIEPVSPVKQQETFRIGHYKKKKEIKKDVETKVEDTNLKTNFGSPISNDILINNSKIFLFIFIYFLFFFIYFLFFIYFFLFLFF